MNLQKLPRGVGTLSLVFIVFFCTSGGPYTTETLIHSVGPGLGLDARLEWILSLAVIWGATWINLRGSVRVGRVSVIAGSFVMLGFLAMSFASIPRIAHIPWQPFASEDRQGLGGLAIGISIALWNYIGWDNPSTVQGEIKDASRSYPRALAWALPFVTLGYFVPLLTALGASDWTAWTEGGWPQIAASAAGTVGRWIAIWIALGGMASALALFNALLLSYSRIPFVLASDGLLPGALARLDARGTPRNAVIVSAVCYSFFALFAFGKLIIADVLLYSLALFLEFGALLQLRKSEPSLRGAFRIPLGRGGVAFLAALPMIVLLGVIGISFRNGEYGLPALMGATVAIAAG